MIKAGQVLGVGLPVFQRSPGTYIYAYTYVMYNELQLLEDLNGLWQVASYTPGLVVNVLSEENTRALKHSVGGLLSECQLFTNHGGTHRSICLTNACLQTFTTAASRCHS